MSDLSLVCNGDCGSWRGEAHRSAKLSLHREITATTISCGLLWTLQGSHLYFFYFVFSKNLSHKYSSTHAFRTQIYRDVILI